MQLDALERDRLVLVQEKRGVAARTDALLNEFDEIGEKCPGVVFVFAEQRFVSPAVERGVGDKRQQVLLDDQGQTDRVRLDLAIAQLIDEERYEEFILN